MKWNHYIKMFAPFVLMVIGLLFFRDQVIQFIDDRKAHLQDWADATTVLGGIIGVQTLVLIWIQLIIQNRQARLLRTYEMSEKIQRQDYLLALGNARIFLCDGYQNQDSKWNDYLNATNPLISQHVYMALAYFEDLGTLYNKAYIDRELVKELLIQVVLDYYEYSGWFRIRMKNRQGPGTYAQWDLMYEHLVRWRSGREPFSRDWWRSRFIGITPNI